MELTYKAKKPETILRFMQENNIPFKILDLENGKAKIYVNKTLKKRKDTIKKGEKIQFFVKDEKRDSKIKPEDKELNIIYEDPYLLIVKKPENMQMMISKAHPTGTLANIINNYYEKNNINSKIHFVTKLDREASGLVLLAKHKYIRYLFSNFDDSLTNYYKAIIDGEISLKESAIPLPIARVEGSIKREVSESGEECTTYYKVSEEYGDFSLIDLRVKKKRAHQIRVHLSYFYNSIVGDRIYGSGTKGDDLMLYCYKIKFTHPLTEEEIKFEMVLPPYFKEFIELVK